MKFMSALLRLLLSLSGFAIGEYTTVEGFREMRAPNAEARTPIARISNLADPMGMRMNNVQVTNCTDSARLGHVRSPLPYLRNQTKRTVSRDNGPPLFSPLSSFLHPNFSMVPPV